MRRLMTFVVVAGFTALATLSWLRDDDPNAVRTATSMAAQAGAPVDADWDADGLAEKAGIPAEAPPAADGPAAAPAPQVAPEE